MLTSPLEFATSRFDRTSELEEGKRGAVASESAICSRHGTDIINIGGNAADAVSNDLADLSVVRHPADSNLSDGCNNALRRNCW